MPAWEYFVVLAGMRTGSNFLEANLNEYSGLACLGELFNPHFIGHAGKTEAHGMTLSRREADPLALVDKVRGKDGKLAGFRLFFDHDPRVVDAVLADPRAAKIVLTRNPLDSYVSFKIAGATGQWRLGDLKHAKSAQVEFDGAEFARMLDDARSFQDRIIRTLQVSGQSAFFLTYDDVGEIDVMNGLARWLGADEVRKATSSRTKKQNPETLDRKVQNYDDMTRALADIDQFDLGRYPVFEQRRGPTVPQIVAAASAPLLFTPIRSGPNARVRAWLAALDGVSGDALQTGFTQKSLRQWMKDRPGHRSFAVLRHPVRRLHDVFCRHVVPGAPAPMPELRTVLDKTYQLKLPDTPDSRLSADEHRTAFVLFAKFINGNLSGQTSVRIDGAWATQLAVLQGVAQFVPPDHLLREDEAAEALPALAAEARCAPQPWPGAADAWDYLLTEVYDDEIEAQVRNAYQRDYISFGFGNWR